MRKLLFKQLLGSSNQFLLNTLVHFPLVPGVVHLTMCMCSCGCNKYKVGGLFGKSCSSFA